MRNTLPGIGSLLELALVWYWELDAELRYTKMVAPEKEKGYDTVRYMGRLRWELPGAIALGGTWEEHRRTLLAREPFHDFQYVVHPAGMPARYLSTSGEPLFDAQGRFTGYRGTSRDITELWLARQRSRQAENLLKQALDSLTDGFGTMDHDWRISYANPAAEPLLQKKREEMVGRVLWEVFPDLAGSGFGELYRRAMTQRQVGDVEAFYEPLNAWFRVRAFPSGDGIAVLFSDITATRRAQQEVLRLNAQLEQRVRERTAELERAYSDLEAFSYMLAHDLRAPIAAIEGFAGFIAREEQALGERSRHYLGRVRTAAAQMNDMTGAILDLARLSRAQVAAEDVDLAGMAREILRTLQESQPQRVVHWELPAALPVRGDRSLLSLVMQNLLSNAWKYSAPRSAARIEVGRADGAPGELHLFVRDNGVGFDSAAAQTLFQPFSRFHGSEFEGTGVGLATVEKIVAKHGGRVWAESQAGGGATIHVVLPRALPAGEREQDELS